MPSDTPSRTPSGQPVPSDIYANAVDSLRIAIEHFLKKPGYSTRKHTILTLFHAIELFLKEQLYRINPILIYRNLDAKITDDSQTVSIKECLVRLENLGIGLAKDPQAIIEKIQKRRNRVEHHRYDHQKEDEVIIAESLKFILFFVNDVLKGKLENDIPPATLREIQRLVYERGERYNLAMHRVDVWLRERWPAWDEQDAPTPDEFDGTMQCPICREDFLVAGYHDRPFCFLCGTSVDAYGCDSCGRIHLGKGTCCSAPTESLG